MFKVGDRVIYYNLTPGVEGIKWMDTYTIYSIWSDNWLYFYSEDFVCIGPYHKDRFLSVIEYRKLKIKKICSKLEIE